MNVRQQARVIAEGLKPETPWEELFVGVSPCRKYVDITMHHGGWCWYLCMNYPGATAEELVITAQQLLHEAAEDAGARITECLENAIRGGK